MTVIIPGINHHSVALCSHTSSSGIFFSLSYFVLYYLLANHNLTQEL